MNEFLSFISGALLFVGVWLINQKDRRAFWFWIIGNSLSFWLHITAGPMWFMSARDIGFLILAVQGLRKWGTDADNKNTEIPARRD